MVDREVRVTGAAFAAAVAAALASGPSCRAATYGVVALTGDLAPGTGAGFSVFNAVSTGLNNRVVFTGRAGAQQNGVWAGPASGVALAAIGGPGAPLPPGVSTPGAAFGTFNFPVSNAAGGFAFTATLTNVTSTTNAGLWVSASAGAPLTLLARKGDQAPGMAAGNVFRIVGLGDGLADGITLSNAGVVSFQGGTSGPATPQNLVVAGVPGALTAAAITNTQAPGFGAGVQFTALDFAPAMNNAGTLAFRADIFGPGIGFVSNQTLWTGAAGACSSAARNGFDQAPGFPVGVVWSALPAAKINDAGQVAFATLTSGPGINQFNSSGLWAGAPGVLSLLVRQGDAAPGTAPGTQFGQIADLRIDKFARVVFLADTQFGDTTANNGAGLWFTRPGGPTRLLARLGAAAPGAGPATILSLNGGMTLNNRGQAAFTCNLSDNTRALYIGSVNSAGAASIEKIARTGELFQVAPGDARTILQIRDNLGASAIGMRTLNDAGALAFILDFTNGTSAVVLARTVLPCPGDTNGDGVVDFSDLNQVLSQFGQSGAGLAGDLNGDGVVDFLDLNIVLGVYGTIC